MNKKVLIIAIVILLLLAGGWYYMTSKGSSLPLTQNSNGNTQTLETVSLKGLISKGLPQTCTFNADNGTGTVYVDGGKVRQDFEITVDDKIIKSHMIVMDNTMYSWSDEDKTGMKMSFDPKATPVAVESPSTSLNADFDTDTSMDYKCGVWLPDSSKFTLPTDITFSSFEIPTTESSQCSYCDSLSGDDKEQCLTALKCE